MSEMQAEEAGLVRSELEGQVTAHVARDRLTDRESKSGTMIEVTTVPSAELVEYRSGFLTLDAATIVGNIDVQEVVTGLATDHNHRMLRWVVFDRIGNQVDQYLLHAIRVSPDPDGTPTQLMLTLNPDMFVANQAIECIERGIDNATRIN